MNQWREAIACYKGILVDLGYDEYGKDHPEYASSSQNLACAYMSVKQYEEAIPLLDKVLFIKQKMSADQVAVVTKTLAKARRLAATADRKTIDVGHFVRMCNFCSTVSEDMLTCSGTATPSCQLPTLAKAQTSVQRLLLLQC